ncbi:MAG: hypothetical protein WBG92_05190 [Thiohalocapsa sp.]
MLPVIGSADYPLTIIDLQHRLPEEVVPLLQPLAGSDGVVTGANASLFVRASPQRLSDIRTALERLDSPARNLLVEVRSRSTAKHRGGSAAITVNEAIGSQGRVRIGGGQQTGIRAGADHETGSRDLLQQVRVMDGGQAFISVGSERPIGYRELFIGPDGQYSRQGTDYVSAESGFYVRPRISGDRVIIDVTSRGASFGRGGDIMTGAVETQLTGLLGEWIPFGGSRSSAERQENGLGSRSNMAGSENSDLELRVRALN